MTDSGVSPRSRTLSLLICGTLIALVAACSSSGGAVGRASFHVTGSVEQVAVTNAVAGHRLELRDRHGKAVATGTVDALGSYLFREIPAGGPYKVRDSSSHPSESTEVTVLPDQPAPPDQKTYDQTLETGFDSAGKAKELGGYGYLTVRDGTKLAVNVHLPGPPSEGPYPTVIEYGGYAFARPGQGESSIAPVWGALGYAVVDVNMRGTGCSGGAFDFFEPLQILDGYDAVETVARQPWVMNHKVGLVGISYGGISQLFVASSNPPHLGAITPNSVIEGVATTLRPGGILNTGFAYSWAEGRVADSKPAGPKSGQPWAWERIQAGDQICKENQALHGQAVDLIKLIEEHATYEPALVDHRSPYSMVGKIKVPTYLSCQWEDEQTGGFCPMLASKFTGTDKVHMLFTNGTHIDSLDPVAFQHQFDLMEMYVAERKPDDKGLKGFLPLVYKAEMAVENTPIPDDPIAAEPDLASARAAFDKLPRVQVLFESGYGGTAPGQPLGTYSIGLTGLNDPSIKSRAFYFAPSGELSDAPPTTATSASFVWDPKARPDGSMTEKGLSDVWKALPAFDWKPLAPGKALAWDSAPLAEDMTVVGGGAVNLWLQSTDTDTDLQVTVTEVRPDGQEVFVQNGWLRASYRKLDEKRSTPLYPMPSARAEDIAPLPAGKWSKLSIPLYAQGHAYRKGSRIRISVEAPGGDQPQWTFRTLTPTAQVTNRIAMSSDMPSGVLLPVVEGATIPVALSTQCQGLRAEPCRTYVPFQNDEQPGT